MTPSPQHLGALVPGGRYRIRMRRQTGNYRWVREEMIADYLGYHDGLRELQFSLRPLFGTTAVPIDWVTCIERVAKKHVAVSAVRRLPADAADEWMDRIVEFDAGEPFTGHDPAVA